MKVYKILFIKSANLFITFIVSAANIVAALEVANKVFKDEYPNYDLEQVVIQRLKHVY